VSGLRTRLLIALVAIVATTGILGVHVPPPQATAQAGLFSDAAGRQPAAPRTPDYSVVRTRYVTVNLGLIDGTPRASGSRGGLGDTLTLNLFDSEALLFPAVNVTAVRDRVEPSSTGQGYVWVGYAQGSNLATGLITIAVHNDVMVADIRAGSSFFRVRHAGDGVHVVQEINERALPWDHGHLYPNRADMIRAAMASAEAAQGSAPTAARAAAPAAISTVDVLIVYTNGFAAQEGASNVAGLIDTAMTQANQAYANAITDVQFRLVGSQQVTYTPAGGDLSTDLRCVTGPNASPPASCPSSLATTVSQLRTNVGADLVSLWVEGIIQPCMTNPCPLFSTGQGWILNASYTGAEQQFAALGYTVVMGRYAPAPSYVFAHEIGHNLGANHDHAKDDAFFQANPQTPPYKPWAFDYVASDNTYRTIMAYPCGNFSSCPQGVNPPIVAYLSNPNLTPPEAPINGRIIGVPRGQAGQADNAGTVVVTGPIVANFRPCAVNCVQPTATPTRTPTVGASATPTPNCSPRPQVSVNTVPGGGQLSVTISSGGGARIQQLQFGTASNALINVPAAGVTNLTGNQIITLPVESLSVSFTVRRQTAGSPTHVNLTVVDGCGSWPTFVGGGSSAGF
jgi:hypothetical protein